MCPNVSRFILIKMFQIIIKGKKEKSIDEMVYEGEDFDVFCFFYVLYI